MADDRSFEIKSNFPYSKFLGKDRTPFGDGKDTPKFDISKFLADFKGFGSEDFPPFQAGRDILDLPDFSTPRGQHRLAVVDLKKQLGFEGLNSFQVFGAELALAALQIAEGRGFIEAHRIRRIADFGAGSGGPTFALMAVARQINAEVVALEQNEDLVNRIIEAGIIQRERVIAGDGIQHLASVPDEERYDLIAAYMLGPDIEGTLFRSLAIASGRALNPGGNLVVTSDGGTFATAREICDSLGVVSNYIMGISDNGKIIVPQTLVIPQESCSGIISSTPKPKLRFLDFGDEDIFGKKGNLFKFKEPFSK